MDLVIVLATHGAPPLDFPRDELIEIFTLGPAIERATGNERRRLRTRLEQLEHFL